MPAGRNATLNMKKDSVPSLRLRFRLASAEDAADISALLVAAADDLTARHGRGPWSRAPSERGVLATLRGDAHVWLAVRGRALAATWTLSRRKPWAIDLSHFTAGVVHPYYLTSMAVAPALQWRGVGQRCVAHAIEWAGDADAGALRLDAYDGAGGAGGFYARCGFTEVGRASYRGTALVYYELKLRPSIVSSR